MINKSLKEFNELLASKQPVPGGGGASALAGGLAAGLAQMVANLTVGKKKYAQSEEQMKQLLSQAASLQQELLDGIQKDADAFYPLSQAYGLSKDDPLREVTMESCLKKAAMVPFELLHSCAKVLDVLEEMLPISSTLAVSDIGTAAALAQGALNGSAINVLVNTKLMKNRSYAELLNKQVMVMLDAYNHKADLIFDNVMERMQNNG
jgi:formiminotetrahydrofolate cyclodeaminase